MSFLQTNKKPITEYQLIREKAASQKRDVERALTRFIAKTGDTEKLFEDDPYAFPRKESERSFMFISFAEPQVFTIIITSMHFSRMRTASLLTVVSVCGAGGGGRCLCHGKADPPPPQSPPPPRPCEQSENIAGDNNASEHDYNFVRNLLF